MLSRVALRSGAFAPAVLRPTSQLSVTSVRCASSEIEKHVENWEKASKIYYGPERDTQKFPITRQPESTPPTRMGILPASWFEFFHPKTGVTGPYMFGAGLMTFLLSKEIWIVEHGFTEFVAFWIAVGILLKKVGPGVSKSLDKLGADYKEKHWDQPKQQAKEQAQAIIASGEHAIWQQEGQKMMFEAKRENIDLQLEGIYRQRLAEVHKQVKRRLDYQTDVEVTKRNFEQAHMVQWIVDNVVKGITPQQEKDSIAKCIGDLKGLAPKV